MSKIIIGNWKMNGTREGFDKWIEEFSYDDKDLIVVAIPSLYLERIPKKFKNIYFAGQDCHQESCGAFTGDVSAKMLAEYEFCKFVIVGHSERRKYHFETDYTVSLKAQAAIMSGLSPVICIGESEEDRRNGKEMQVIEEQVLSSLPQINFSEIIIAYEPIWSIGTGIVPSLEEIEEACGYVKYIVSGNRSIPENRIKVLYGGSVKTSNAAEIKNTKNVDGLLVGGASLNLQDFLQIIYS